MGITEENEFSQFRTRRGAISPRRTRGNLARAPLGLALAAQDGPPWGVSVCRMC